MSYNPHAVLMFSPAYYTTHVDIDGKTYELNAAQQGNGNYSVTNRLPCEERERVDAMFKAQGLRGLSRSQVPMAEMVKMLALLDARVNARHTEIRNLGPAYAAFLQAQLDSHKSPAPPWEFVQARDSFIRMATELLQAIQKTHFQQFAIRELVNPVQSVALSKQRAGVFVWPDWEDARYVNLVCTGAPDTRREMREVIHDWAETQRLRINIGVHF